MSDAWSFIPMLTDEELAELVDQGLASMRARVEDPAGDWEEWPELQVAIHRTCDEWDRFADAMPGFRDA